MKPVVYREEKSSQTVENVNESEFIPKFLLQFQVDGRCEIWRPPLEFRFEVYKN